MDKKQKKKFNISQYHVFICFILVVKILLMAMFSSDYQKRLFEPFVDSFIHYRGNTYQIFYENGITNAFPYPFVMLAVQSLGAGIASVLGITSGWIKNVMFKLPSLGMDFLILHYLVKLFPAKKRYAAVLYFASPIILYAVYMHGQLDLIPTGFLIISLYYLVADKSNQSLRKAAVFFAMALLSKLHILAAMPIIVLFILKRDGIKKVIEYNFIVVTLVLFGMFPFWSGGFIQTVLFNPEQTVLSQVFLTFSTVKIYIPIIAVLLIYLNTYNINLINKNLLFSLLGVLFGVFLALCPPMPGWYVWIVPFITIFFIQVNQNKYRNIGIYVLLNGLYIIYFGVFHRKKLVDLYLIDKDLSFLKMNQDLSKNIIFTLMAGTLLYIIYSMYQLGITSNLLYRRRNLPFTIGIAGDSGSGKSTLIRILEKCLGQHNILFIEGDGDHKWERGEKEWDNYTHLNPKANYLYRQAEDIKQLRTGSAISRVDYNHTTGKFDKAHRISPNKFIILCGLHSLYLPQMRRCMDLKIYMDVDEQLRRHWKIQRDIRFRGYSKEKIQRQIEERLPDAVKYIIPQRNYSDLLIQYFDKTLTDCMVENHEDEVSLKLTFGSDVNAEPIILELAKYGINAIYDYSEDLKKQIIIFEGNNIKNKVISVQEIAENVVLQLDEITNQKLECKDTLNGIVELFLLLLISYKMQEEI